MVVVLRKPNDNMQTIMELLPKLTDAEKDQIIHAIKSRRQFMAATSSAEIVHFNHKHDYDWMLDCVARELVSYGLAHMSIASLRSRVSGFKSTAEDLQEWLTQAMPDGKHVQHVALFSIGVRLLLKEMAELHLMVSHKTVMVNLFRLPSLVDYAFPGYARCGILSWIVRAEGSDNVRNK